MDNAVDVESEFVEPPIPSRVGRTVFTGPTGPRSGGISETCGPAEATGLRDDAAGPLSGVGGETRARLPSQATPDLGRGKGGRWPSGARAPAHPGRRAAGKAILAGVSCRPSRGGPVVTTEKRRGSMGSRSPSCHRPTFSGSSGAAAWATLPVHQGPERSVLRSSATWRLR